MSSFAQKWLDQMLRAPDLNTSEKVVGIVICQALVGHEWWQVTYREMGNRSALSRGVIRRAVAGLECKGWLAIDRPIAEAGIYALALPTNADCS